MDLPTLQLLLLKYTISENNIYPPLAFVKHPVDFQFTEAAVNIYVAIEEEIGWLWRNRSTVQTNHSNL